MIKVGCVLWGPAGSENLHASCLDMPKWLMEDLLSSKGMLQRFGCHVFWKKMPPGMGILQASVTAKELFQDLVPWHLGLLESSSDDLSR